MPTEVKKTTGDPKEAAAQKNRDEQLRQQQEMQQVRRIQDSRNRRSSHAKASKKVINPAKI